MEKALTAAVDIGGTKIQLGIVDREGHVLAETAFPTDCENTPADKTASRIAEELRGLCGSLGVPASELRGIGVACAGPVDTAAGTVENPYTLPGWGGFPLVRRLSEDAGLEVRLENDAAGALLGEVLQRGLQEKKVLMVTLGTGVGAAFYGDGKLYRSGRYHPEMGHVIVASDGDECYCGHRGCFESRCSGRALNLRAERAGFADFNDLFRRAGTGEGPARALLEEMERELKNGFWSLNVVFKPEVLILAGGFGTAHFEWLRDMIAADSADKEDFLDRLTVLPASGGKNPALVGAAMFFKEENA